jgi:hypothetical protein
MSKFVKGDKVVLLKDFEPYLGNIIPAGTDGLIVSLLSGHPTLYRVNFPGYGWYDVRNDILSLRRKKEVIRSIFKDEYALEWESSTYRSEAFDISSSIKDVLYKDPATIIFWKDGTKSVVVCDGEEYDPEKGFAMAACKKVFGNKGNYYNTFKKWLPEKTEFEVGKVFKLSKEIYGLPVGTLVRITHINEKTGKVSLTCKKFKGEFTTNKKYLKPF